MRAKETKVCTTCKEPKPVSSFVWRNKKKGIRRSYCTDCKADHQKRWHQEWYHEGPGRRFGGRAGSSLYKERLLKWLRDYKESRPCADCKNGYPHYVVDFDHVDPPTKLFGISRESTRHRGARKFKEEVAKCGVACANCHRERTHRREDHKLPSRQS